MPDSSYQSHQEPTDHPINSRPKQPSGGISSLTKLIKEQNINKNHNASTTSSTEASALPPYNRTITTTISLEGVSPSNSFHDESTYDPRRDPSSATSPLFSSSVSEVRSSDSSTLITGNSNVKNININNANTNGFSSAAGKPIPMRFTPTRTPSTPTSGSYVNLSNAIPYSAPGGRSTMNNNGNGVTLSTSSNSNYNMPNLANGQIITGTHISSPAISSPTQLEPRFIISKQKLEARNIAVFTSG
ncbi:unnamed protein product [Ambrosiozyma monospora]|uniref:Unnamed protein product n=1 Tax=Ambrosiozyma monospora TaxID=43982 RepID=A0ACB5T610_AMBMO|nr:unnamed protein product [Ambrosiozyma monospora]